MDERVQSLQSMELGAEDLLRKDFDDRGAETVEDAFDEDDWHDDIRIVGSEIRKVVPAVLFVPAFGFDASAGCGVDDE